MSSVKSPAASTRAVPADEVPGPDDWFVWPVESDGSTTTAVRICFRSWISPGRWMTELATVCNSARA